MVEEDVKSRLADDLVFPFPFALGRVKLRLVYLMDRFLVELEPCRPRKRGVAEWLVTDKRLLP